MPNLTEHQYQDDFQKAISNYAQHNGNPTSEIEMPSTGSTIDHIQFGNHREAPVV